MILQNSEFEISTEKFKGIPQDFIFVDWICNSDQLRDENGFYYELSKWEFVAYNYDDDNNKYFIDIDYLLADWIKTDCETEAYKQLNS